MKHLIAALACIGWATSAMAKELGDTWLSDLPDFDVLLLGEVHDNPAHHLNQAAALKVLKPAAVVFEMLTPEQAEIVEATPVADRADLGRALDWEHSGWPEFAIYAPVFQALGGARVYGATVPRTELMTAVTDGAASVWGKGAGDAGLGPLSAEEQTEREALQMAAHCDALPEDMLAGMVEAQRLRDARFAASTVQAMQETGGPVVVITGNGHARKDWGMPVYLAAQAAGARVVSLAQFETSAGVRPPYDFWLITEATEREDPCAVFEKRG